MSFSLIPPQITRICSWEKKPTDSGRKSSTIHAQSPLETEAFLRVYKWAGSTVNNEPGKNRAGGGGRWWQGIWELGKPSAVHPVLSAFLVCVFSESALAKFSRKPSTKYSLGIQGTSLISPSDLDKSEAWKQGNPDVSVMKWSRVGPHLFPEVSIQTGDRLPLILLVPIWGAPLALKGLTQWPSTSAWCCFLPPSGPQGSWSKALSAQKVGFLPDCQPEARQDLANCPKTTKFLTEFLGWDGAQCRQKISLVVLLCQKCFHHVVNFTKMILIYLYVILTFIFGYGIFLWEYFETKHWGEITCFKKHFIEEAKAWLWKILSNHLAWGKWLTFTEYWPVLYFWNCQYHYF